MVVATARDGSSYTYQVEQNPAGVITNLNFSMVDTVFEASGGTLQGRVACPEGSGQWEVSSCPAWLTMTPSSGGTGLTTVEVTAGANTGATRFGEIVVRAGVDTDSVNFGQQTSGTPFVGIEVTLDQYDFNGSGDTVNGVVKASEDWIMQTSGYWLTPSVNSGTTGETAFTLTVSPNYGRYPRTGSITAIGDNYQDEDSITQDIIHAEE